MKVFHTSVSWWFFTGVRMTASFLTSPGLFSVFWPISTLLYFGWSPLILLFPSPSVLESNLWLLYWAHQLQLVSASLSCSIVFCTLARSVTHLSFRFPPILPCGQPERQNTLFDRFSLFFYLSIYLLFFFFFFFFFLTITRSGRLAEKRWSVCISKSREFGASHFLGRILGCVYTTSFCADFLQFWSLIRISCKNWLGLYPRLGVRENINYIYSLLKVFHTSVSWWFFTGVRMTASFLTSPGLFSVFWPISTLLYFGWSPLILLFSRIDSCIKSLVTVLSTLITIGISVTFMFHRVFVLSQGLLYISLYAINNNIWSKAFYFSFSLDCKVLAKRRFFSFCYWFCLVFRPFFGSRYSIVWTYFPLTIIFY